MPRNAAPSRDVRPSPIQSDQQAATERPPAWWRALVADPDPAVLTRFTNRWANAGGLVVGCQSGAEVLYHAGRVRPDLIVLAALQPLVGIDVIATTLREYLPCPIVIGVSSGDTETLGDHLARVLAIERTEIVSRPYDKPALTQLDRLVDQISRSADVVVELGPLNIDVARLEAKIGNRVLSLTVREFQILHFLATHHDHVIRPEEIIANSWPAGSGQVRINTLNVHLGRLRRVLAGTAEIVSLRGVGYRFSLLAPEGDEHTSEPQTR